MALNTLSNFIPLSSTLFLSQRLAILDGGHNIHQTASETFNRVVQEFLRKEDEGKEQNEAW